MRNVRVIWRKNRAPASTAGVDLGTGGSIKRALRLDGRQVKRVYPKDDSIRLNVCERANILI